MREDLQKEYIEKMKVCIREGDMDEAHRAADKLLCELLKKLGYTKLVAAYGKVDKWYS